MLLMENDPLGEQVTVIELVVDVPEHPVGNVHVNVYGVVPPVPAAVQVNDLPDVTPVVGHVVVSDNACAATTADADADALLTLFRSLATLLIE